MDKETATFFHEFFPFRNIFYMLSQNNKLNLPVFVSLIDMSKISLFKFLILLSFAVISKCLINELKSAEAYYNEGLDLMIEQNYEQASQKLRRAIQKGPPKQKYYVYYTFVLLQIGNYEEMKKVSKKGVELFPYNPSLHNNHGVAVEIQNSCEQAIVDYEKALSLDGQKNLYYENIGKCLNEQKVSKKVKHLKEDDHEYFHDLGTAFYRKQFYRTALYYFMKMVQLYPNYYHYYHDIALTLKQLKRCNQAIQYFEKTIQLQEDNEFYVDLAQCINKQSMQMGIQHSKNNAESFYKIGSKFFKLQRYPSAQYYLKKAIQLSPSQTLYYNDLALSLYAQEKYEMAEEYYKKAIKLSEEISTDSPQNTAVLYYNLADSQYKQKKYEQAEKSMLKALEFDENPKYYNFLGNIIKESGQGTQKCSRAIYFYEKAIQLEQKVYTYFSNLQKCITPQIYEQDVEHINDNSTQYFYYLGNLFQEKQKNSVAEYYYKKAIQLDPDNIDFYNGLATSLRKQKKLPEAEQYYKKAITIEPKNPTLINNLISVLTEQQKFEQVEIYLEKAQIENADAEYYFNLGNAFSQKQNFQERNCQKAIWFYEKAIFLDSEKQSYYDSLADCIFQISENDEVRHLYKNGQYFHNLGRKFYEKYRYSASEYYLKKAIKVDPENFNYHNDLGITLNSFGKHQGAEQAYRKAVSLKPNDDVLHSNLAWSLYAQEKYFQAEEQFREAIELNPKNAFHHNGLGKTLLLQGKYFGAKQAFQKAIELKADEAVFYDNYATVLEQQGRVTEAVSYVNKALALEPYNSDFINHKGRLTIVRTRYRIVNPVSTYFFSSIFI